MSEEGTASLVLVIRLNNGTKFDACFSKESGDASVDPAVVTVRKVKEKVATLDAADRCPAQRQRLIFKGRILEDDRTLSDYGIVHKSTLFLVKAAGTSTNNTQPQAPANTTTQSSSSSSTLTNPSSSASTNTTSTPPSTNSPYMFGGASPFGMPSGNAMGSGGGFFPPGMPTQGPPRTPEQMEQMMNHPMLRHILDNNPDMLRTMMQQQMQNDPAMQQVLQNNPALQQMLNDPGAWEQVVQMIRNPAAMQQALRQQDLALQNIENMPGGMAALQNMYQDFQQPLQDSLMPGGGSGGGSTSSSTTTRSSGGAGASGQAMPNPWGTSTNTSTTASSNSSRGNTLGSSGGTAASSDPWSAMMGGAAGGGTSNPGMMFPPMPPPGTTMNATQRQQVMSMLENPAVANMMRAAYQQNPDLFRNMLLQQNPALAQMLGNNPAQIDAFFNTMMDPTVMRSMMQMEEQMRGMGLVRPAGGNSAAVPNPWGAFPAATPPAGGSGGLDFSSLFQQQQQQPPAGMFPWMNLGGMNNNNMSTGTTAPSMPSNNMLPAERYARQLRSLYDMGFDDEQQSLQALVQAHGNVNRAVDLMLSGSVMPTPPSSQTTTTTTSTSGDASSSTAAAAPGTNNNGSTSAQPNQEQKPSDENKKDE